MFARVASRRVFQRQLQLVRTKTYFTADHEYAKVANGVATCGITDFAQTQLGDVVYVSLPQVGDSFKKGQAMASVESVKAASDVYAPVSGTVAEVNPALGSNPALVNESAEDKAWFVKLTLTGGGVDAKEAEALLDETKYKAHVAESAH